MDEPSPTDNAAKTDSSIKTINGKSFFVGWLELFLAVLCSPKSTLIKIKDGSFFPNYASSGATILVALTSLVSKVADSGADGVHPTVLNLIGAVVGGFFCWFSIAAVLRLLCWWQQKAYNLRTCFTLTGWAFLPLIFKGPLMCLSFAFDHHAALFSIIFLWFIFLLLQAFDCLLQLGKLRLILLAVMIPPLVLLVWFFWMIAAAGLLAYTLSLWVPDSLI